ncbi:MAG: type I-E CRISPR-associated endonuclease Cas1 [Anaerolinea sp.]|nr:type I-E CRISPR-associated endonuclease Cas1 [Anaerolinea sp.]
MQDLHQLPKLRDSLSYLYVEHAVIERQDGAVLFMQETGRTAVPAASLTLLLLGPGTTITHAAIGLLAESGCSTLWIGEDMQKFYAQGLGETRRAYHLLRQAEMVSDSDKRMNVVIKMYAMRFGYELPTDLSLEQIRGMEGARVRTAYSTLSRKFGISWQGRRYDRGSWSNSDPVNRALSAANAVLNGICHAAIVSGGYSPALGFLHTGKQLSFVYDIADLYKTEITVPIAFQIAAEGPHDIEIRARTACRETFREQKLLERILPDIDRLLDISEKEDLAGDDDPACPEPWWQPVEMAQEEKKW